ncbi:MAG: ATP-grasp domain-containing protein [Waddliaceae bacterium]
MKRTFIPPHYRPYVPGTDFSYVEKKSTVLSLNPIIILAVKEDIVPKEFMRELGNDATRVSLLYYDDLGDSWDFAFYKGELHLFQDNSKIKTIAIYHRHPGLKKSHPAYFKHLAFLEALEQWNGKLVGQRHCHFQNSSKMYQMICSMQKAQKETEEEEAVLPYSFFIKGHEKLAKQKLNSSLIVKSCSSHRSKVATREEFQKWDREPMKHLPTLFQQHIKGSDLRVHVCDSIFWTLKVKNKDHVDYRYSTRGSVNYEHTKISSGVQKFCKALATKEKNSLVGIDFVHSDGKYYCLESNPGPGWSTFNHPSKTEFAYAVFFKLMPKSDPFEELQGASNE